MANIYDKALSTAEKMINKYGRTSYLVSITKSGVDYDPVITETEVEIKLLESRFSVNEIDGTLIKTDDKKFLIAGSVAPTIEMKIKDNGKSYSIINILETKPGNKLILSKIQARL